MAELNFEQPEGEEPEQPQEEQLEAEPEPEIEAQAPEEEPDRLVRLEQAVSQLVDWARSSQTPQAAAPAPQPSRKKPDFGNNPVADALWEEIQGLRNEIKEPWERLEKQREEDEAVRVAQAQLFDDAAQYINNRKASGDPEIKGEELVTMLISMGQLRDRRIPIQTALKNAYNAVAYDKMKDNVRNNTFNEVRKPGARLPAPYRPQAGQRLPQTATSRAPRPGESRLQALKREMEASDRQVAGMTPEQLEDSLGGSIS
jgi:hypothetical protein